MSNKPFTSLNILDQQLRKTYPAGMSDGVKVTIELICGFELFNTRPYHNYEDWADGYRVTDKKTGIQFESEDLDDAIVGFIKKVRDEKDKTILKERFKDRSKPTIEQMKDFWPPTLSED